MLKNILIHGVIGSEEDEEEVWLLSNYCLVYHELTPARVIAGEASVNYINSAGPPIGTRTDPT